MKLFRTTVELEFHSMESEDSIHYGSYLIRPGILCRCIRYTTGITLIPVKRPNLYVMVYYDNNCYVECNEMEILAEVYAGNVPDETLVDL